MKQKIYQGFKKVIKLPGKGSAILASYLDDTLEKVLEHIPNYAQKRDETLENCLYKILEGEKLSFGEQLKVGFQAPSVKSVLVGSQAIGIGMTYSFIANDITPFYEGFVFPPLWTLIAVTHDAVMGQKLERIVDSLTKEEKEVLKECLNDKKIDEIRERLYYYGW